MKKRSSNQISFCIGHRKCKEKILNKVVDLFDKYAFLYCLSTDLNQREIVKKDFIYELESKFLRSGEE